MSDIQHKTRVLIVSRAVWEDNRGTSSTLTNLFSDYGADRLAHIYIETKIPNTKCCDHFFQISEFALIKRLFNFRIKTGRETHNGETVQNAEILQTAKKESGIMSYVRSHRSYLFSFLRELLWAFNGWKSKELCQFIVDFKPDVVWVDGSPLILMNRLGLYVKRIANKPCAHFLQDDAYTYKSCSGWASKIFRCAIRPHIKRLVKESSTVFVASPKMKEEYDAIFGINSIFLAKGADFSTHQDIEHTLNKPLRLVYLGQVIYGRIYSLISLSKVLQAINKDKVKAQLFVYTNNAISDELKKQLLAGNSTFLVPPVPYNEVANVIHDADIVVFVESFERKYKNVARLSFSTKLCDYLSSGRAILAVGPEDIAPMNYLKDNKAAFVCISCEEIAPTLETATNNPDLVQQMATQSYACAKRNHDIKDIHRLVESTIATCAKGK